MKNLYPIACVTFIAFMLFSKEVIGQCVAPPVNGPSTVCQSGVSSPYETTAGMSNYEWAVQGGQIFNPTPYVHRVNVVWESVGAQSISVRYRDANNCVTPWATLPVTVNARPIPSLNGNASACQYSTNNTYTTDAGQPSYAWLVSGGTITAGQGTSQVTVTWTSTNGPRVSVSYGSVPCASTVTQLVVNVSPVAVNISGSDTPCLASAANYGTAFGKSNYNWNVTGGTIQSGQGTAFISVLWTTTGTQNIGVSFTDPSGCIGTPSGSKTIQVTGVSPASIAGPQSVCQHGDGEWYETQVGMSNYSWTTSTIPGPPGFGDIPAGRVMQNMGNRVKIKWYHYGSHTVNVSYTTPTCNIPSTGSLPVTIAQVPYPTLTGTTSGICQGATAEYTSGLTYPTYNWSVTTGGTILSGQGTNKVMVQWNTPYTHHQVFLNHGTINGCQTPAGSIYVNVNPVPGITVNQSGSSCSGDNFQVNLNSNVSPVTWSWSALENPNVTGETTTPQTTNAIIQTLTNTTNTKQNVVYNVTATAASNGCGTFTPYQITMPVPPKPTITSPSAVPICSGRSLVHNFTSNVADFVSFQFIAADNPNVTGEHISGGNYHQITGTLINTTTVPQTVVYTVTPRTSFCTGPIQTLTFTVNPMPKLVNASTITVCSGAPFTYPLTSVVPATFTWKALVDDTYIDGETNTPQTNSTISNTLVNNWHSARSVLYEVTSTATAGGCTQVEYVDVVVHPKFTANHNTGNTCSNAGINVYLSNSNGQPSTYSWVAAENPNLTGESTTPQTSNIISDVVRNLTVANQDVVYTVTPIQTSTGCAGTPRVIPITIRPEPVITSTDALTTCSATAMSHTFTSTYPVAFLWSATDNPNVAGELTSTQNSSVLTNTLTNSSTSVQAVNYSVRGYLATYNCYGAVQNLIINVQPRAGSTTQNKTICSGQPANLSLTSASAGATFTWSVYSITSTISGVTVGQTGSGDLITQVLTNSSSSTTGNVVFRITPAVGGCPGAPSNVMVTVNPQPTLTVSPTGPITFCEGGTVVLTATSNGSGHQWSRNDVDIPNANATTYPATQTGIYKVRVTNSFSCPKTSSGTSVTVNPKPSIPTISPSGEVTVCPLENINFAIQPEANVTYQWLKGTTVVGTNSPSFTTNQAGSYTVRKTYPTGCFSVSAATQLQHKQLANVTTANKMICTGTSTNLALTADLPSPTFSWYILSVSSTITGVSVGQSGTDSPINSTLNNSSTSTAGTVVFRVTPTANGCVGNPKDITVTVSSPPTATITPSSSGPICSTEMITLSGPASGGGNNALTYRWLKNGAFLSTSRTITIYGISDAASYWLTVTNQNGCTADAQYTVTGDGIYPVITPSGNVSVCSTPVLLSAGPYNIDYTRQWQRYSGSSWVNVATTANYSATSAGRYRVVETKMETSCSLTSQETVISLISTPTPSISGSTNQLCGEYVTLTAIPGNGTLYTWSTGYTSSLPYVNMISTGSYTVTVRFSNGCTRTSAPFVISTCSGGNPDPCNPTAAKTGPGPVEPCEMAKAEILADRAVISPNPAAGKEFTVTLPDVAPWPVGVRVISGFGTEAFSGEIAKGERSIRVSTSTLPMGMYVVQLRIGARMLNRKVLVTR